MYLFRLFASQVEVTILLGEEPELWNTLLRSFLFSLPMPPLEVCLPSTWFSNILSQSISASGSSQYLHRRQPSVAVKTGTYNAQRTPDCLQVTLKALRDGPILHNFLGLLRTCDLLKRFYPYRCCCPRLV